MNLVLSKSGRGQPNLAHSCGKSGDVSFECVAEKPADRPAEERSYNKVPRRTTLAIVK